MSKRRKRDRGSLLLKDSVRSVALARRYVLSCFGDKRSKGKRGKDSRIRVKAFLKYVRAYDPLEDVSGELDPPTGIMTIFIDQ
jgi:hypothetical protein